MSEFLRRAAILVWFVSASMLASAQTHNAIACGGYGFPSILRFAMGRANINTTTGYYTLLGVGGVGPLHFKAEYVYKKRLGIAFSGVYNSLAVNYATKFYDTFRMTVQEQVLGGRINGYLINKPKQQLYIGAGVGYTDFFNITRRTSDIADTFNATFQPITDFQDRKTFELTLGYRFFPRRHIGFFAEIGSGKIMSQFRHYGFYDSWVQTGISWRLTPWSAPQAKKRQPKKKTEAAELVQ
jgi:hypothetical protein